jgi:hypothetical protein
VGDARHRECGARRSPPLARVRSRGRQIRTRRRLGIASIAAVVVVGIAAPAIAIGSRSSTSHRVPVTAPSAAGNFRIALVERTSSPPCAPGTFGFQAVCLAVGKTVIYASDVLETSVVHQGTFWVVNLTVEARAIRRLAALAPRQAATIVNDRVISAPRITAGLSGMKFQIAQDGLTREQAIELAKAAAGKAPARIDPQPDLRVRIELNSDTIVAGSTMKGRLVVDNTTNQEINLAPTGCWPHWAVTLRNSEFVNSPPFKLNCETGQWLVAPGENWWPFTIDGSYVSCTRAPHPPSRVPICPPETSPLDNTPPLRPGAYEAVLVSDGRGFLPYATPVPVQVVAQQK